MHSDFRLNGVSYDRDHLLSYAHELSNEKQEYLSELGRFILDWFSEKPDLVLQTSGSTGKPTQILAPKTMLSASAMTTVKAFNLQPKQQALMCLPVRHIAGKMMLIRALLAGLWIDIIEPTATFGVSKTYDFTAMTPHQLRNSIDHIDQFKQIIVGGAPVDDSLRAAVKGHASRIFSTYGMTETYSHVALQNLSKGERQYTAVGDVTFSIKEDALVIHAPHIGIEKLVTTDCVDLVSPTEFVWNRLRKRFQRLFQYRFLYLVNQINNWDSLYLSCLKVKCQIRLQRSFQNSIHSAGTRSQRIISYFRISYVLMEKFCETKPFKQSTFHEVQ